jgi:uncharacterized protein YfaP (DUF2135 family)
MSGTVEIVSPADGARLTSPLVIIVVRYSKVRGQSATIKINEVLHVVELNGTSGEIRENVTLLTGRNAIEVTMGKAMARSTVILAKSKHISIGKPKAASGSPQVTTRATEFAGSYRNVSCPAGVISVNGFMQQFAVAGKSGKFNEMVVLRHGANHLAVQIGEYYATRLVQGTFDPARLLVTLVWDTDHTDIDLYTTEPSGETVWFSSKTQRGNLDVDRTQGFGPENYSLTGSRVPLGRYVVRVHYYAAREVGRSEWTVRVITDEGSPKQKRRTYYGILDRSAGNSGPGGVGLDWDDVCVVTLGKRGAVEFEPTGY